MEKWTAKEASDLLGISKNTIMYRLSKLPADLYIKEDGKIYIYDAGIDELKKGIKPSQEPKTQKDISDNSKELIQALQGQIEQLQNQLTIKDEQIRTLTECLNIEQRIHAQFIGKLEAKTESEEPAKKGVFARIFRRGGKL